MNQIYSKTPAPGKSIENNSKNKKCRRSKKTNGPANSCFFTRKASLLIAYLDFWGITFAGPYHFKGFSKWPKYIQLRLKHWVISTYYYWILLNIIWTTLAFPATRSFAIPGSAVLTLLGNKLSCLGFSHPRSDTMTCKQFWLSLSSAPRMETCTDPRLPSKPCQELGIEKIYHCHPSPLVSDFDDAVSLWSSSLVWSPSLHGRGQNVFDIRGRKRGDFGHISDGQISAKFIDH